VITPASVEASHDINRATGQANDVVSDGPDQMAGQASCLQPFESRPVGTAQKPDIHHSLSATSLGIPGKVFQVLRIRLHDVEMGRPGRKDGFLWTGRQSAPEPVLGLAKSLGSYSMEAAWMRHAAGRKFLAGILLHLTKRHVRAPPRWAGAAETLCWETNDNLRG
jgi:hypothetical protein